MPWSHEPKSNSSKSKSRRKNLCLKRGSSWFLYFVCRASVWSKTPEWVQTKTQRQKDIADDEMQEQKKRRCVCNLRELHCTAHSLIYRSSCFRTPMNMPIPFCVSSTLDCDFLLLVLLLLLHLVVGPFSCFHKEKKNKGFGAFSVDDCVNCFNIQMQRHFFFLVFCSTKKKPFHS